MTRTPLRRAAAATAAVAATLVATAALVLGGASTALAHVSVSSSSDAPGSRAVLTFRAPTESDTASTVGLHIHLPAETPFSSVRIKPVAGWTAELIEQTLPEPIVDAHGNTVTTAVTEIVWTAVDGGLAPDQYGEFEVSVSPLPESGTVFFPTVQTYSDGTEVDWVQQAEAGSAEPEHPAPSIEIAAGGAADGAAGDAAETATDAGDHTSGDTVAARAEAVAAPAGADWPLLFGIAGFVVALAAAVTAGVALQRTRE